MSMLLISTLFYAQQGTEIPDFTPPSPEAAAITQYGNVEINESTGKATASVPVYTYQSGQITVPISLSYVGSGVKVNTPNTWTGINWTLNAGGVISRTVNDAPDELAQQRIFEADIDTLGLEDGHSSESTNPANNAGVLHQYFTHEPWDTQPDIFSFSFSGYGGSFYLDENFNPVLINRDTALKIEIEGSSDNKTNLKNTKEFKITTPDGVKYYFGGSEVETSLMEYGWHTNVQPDADTGYYINRIEHPINGIVYFEYINNNNVPINYETYTSAIHSAQIYMIHPGSGGHPMPSNLIEKKDAEGRLPQYAPALTINRIKNAKFLQRIHSPNNGIEVIFNSNNTINGGRNFERVLESIVVKNNNTTLHEVEFNYIFDYDTNGNGIGQRFFLERVTINKDLNNDGFNAHDYKTYTFVYNNPTGLPNRFSYAQDHYGFYNGADDNTGLFPTVTVPGASNLIHPINTYSDNANRSFVFDKSLYGSLEQIIYPTKGSTVFEYEYHAKKKKTKAAVNLNTYRNDYPDEGGSGLTYPNDLSEEVIIGTSTNQGPGPIADESGNTTSVSSSGILENQEVLIYVSFQALENIYDHNVRARFKVINVTDGNTEEHNESIVLPVNSSMNATSFIARREHSHEFLKDKQYKIELTLEGNTSKPMRASLRFEYYNGLEVVNGGNLRVKRVHDKPSNSETTHVKRYYYLPKETMLNDPFKYLEYYIEPNYVKPTLFLISTGQAEDVFNKSIDPHPGAILESNPTNITKDALVNNYSTVTISYGGDNFEQGGVEKRFNKDDGNVINIYKSPRIETSQFENLKSIHAGASWLKLSHGKLKKETILTKKADTLYKANEKRLSYTNTTKSNLFAYVGSFFEDIGPGFSMPYTSVGMGRYEIRSKEVLLKNTIEKNYIDQVPVAIVNIPVATNPYTFQGWKTQDHDNDGTVNFQDDDYLALIENYNALINGDESNYRNIVMTTEHEYNSYSGQPTKTIVTTSDSVKKYETINRYADESVAIANGDNTQLGHYNNLETAHRVSTPLQTESYVNINNNVTLLSKNRTLYSNDSGKILPLKIQTAKGNQDLEDRIEFVDYDGNGNPTEVRKTNGSITKYSYNNLNQVTKKIENFVGLNSNPNTNGTDCENLSSLYRGAFVTSYYYDATTNLITHIVSPNCQTIYYEYDEQHRLKYVKDQDGNILSKNEYNYTTQN